MSAADRVATRTIQEAVRGREAAVLKALGIAWDGGAPHIHCPYPDHADGNPSWRWNEKKRRAHCTCLERAHSISDVVMRREGIDFAAAKLRVAEILGRDDLIRPSDGERRQAMDAASLMRPAADQRDNDLPRAYLAHRLGLTPDGVPLPTTPVVGWRCLPYYDPPAKAVGKPKLVGHFPCVVFGTLAPDGRRHAQRIYVARGGQGKAELGAIPVAGRAIRRSRRGSATARPPPGAPFSGATPRRRRTSLSRKEWKPPPRSPSGTFRPSNRAGSRSPRPCRRPG